MKCEKENIESSINNIRPINNANYNYDNYNDYSDYSILESPDRNDSKKLINADLVPKSSDVKDIYKPFEFIFNYKEKETKDLNKFYYIIGNNLNIEKTDVSKLIQKYDKKMKIYVINIIDMNLEIYSLIGNGSSCIEKNLSDNLYRQIQDSQKGVYDEVKYSLENKNNNELILDYNRNESLSENQLANYFFTLKGKVSGQIDINNAYKKDEDELKDIYSFNEYQITNLKEGDILSKIIAHNIIQKTKENNETIKELSEKYQILCQNTNLSSGEEISQNNIIDNSNSNDDNNILKYNNIFIGKKKDKPIDDENSDLLSKVISSQNFKGSWDENQYTNQIIEMKKDLYNKVNKYYAKKQIAITYIILNYMKGNIDYISKYSEEIENAENYLIKNNCSYDSIQQNLNQRAIR